jgi:hypothetical protein
VKVVPVTTGAVPGSATGVVAEAAGPRHDLAVISLDFDPPLRVLQIERVASDLSLLVAVDNKGTFTERQVAIVAELRSQDDELLVRQRKVVDSIAPGQAAVVKVTGFGKIPARPGYVVAARVESVAGESNVDNNATTLPLQLILSN